MAYTLWLSRVVPAVLGLAALGAVTHAILRRRAAEAPPRTSLAPSCPKDMALLPEGRYILADRHTTGAVEPFCMDRTEVTVSAYAGCVAAKRCSEPDPFTADNPKRLACNWHRPGFDQHPINCLNWAQADTYCGWVNKRLPTEEEWEWAARGGVHARPVPWGDGPLAADRLNACGLECVAWAKSNQLGKDWNALYDADDGWPTTAPVGSFPGGATAEGLVDMLGNVWEWTSTDFDKAGSKKVTRGGGWSDYKADKVRIGFRGGDPKTIRGRSLGFRCAG